MIRSTLFTSLCGLILVSLFLPVQVQADVLACRTEWEQHDGSGLQSWGFNSGQHGAIMEYDYASIPDPYGGGWGASPNGQSIDYNLSGDSTLCGQLDCRYGAEFTYFKTHIYLPPQLDFTEAWVDVTVVDDGVRMTVFSPTHPNGVTDPGGYAYLGGGVSSNLLPYMSSDPWSVVVLTHVDDCCSQSYIEGVDFYVYVGGRNEAVPTDCDVWDDDGDGWPEAGGDCDDSDPARHPGAVELPNGIDDDCDGVVDEGTDLFDDDGDGFTEQEGDCDDGSSVYGPEAPEDCSQDDLDFDCDGCPGSTDPDCGGTCGEEEEHGDDDDEGEDGSGDSDDSQDSGLGGGGELTAAPASLPGCGCLDQSLELQWLALVLLFPALRRGRSDAA
ncbi:MAG: putative metal-binding motif-containing protein [Myxococcota bacterium]|nr:putative metal-binding motif-containing protein [Myxococcota bacterium]